MLYESHLDRGMAVMIHVSHEFHINLYLIFQIADDRGEQLLKSIGSVMIINTQLVLFSSVLFILTLL